MPSKCGCAGGSCGCKVIAGRGTKVHGTGAQNNPIVIDAYPMSLSVTDTTTVDMHLTGTGSTSDPWIISADIANVGMGDKWKMWSGTQVAYDALGVKDTQTLYAITG